MTKIISSSNCGNSPKVEFLKDLNIAFAKGDVKFRTENVSDEIVWNIIGNRKIEGKEKFVEEFEQMKSEKATELAIDQVLLQGKERAAEGIMKMQNGKKYAFSDFHIFKVEKGVKIKSISSYVIEI